MSILQLVATVYTNTLYLYICNTGQHMKSCYTGFRQEEYCVYSVHTLQCPSGCITSLISGACSLTFNGSRQQLGRLILSFCVQAHSACCFYCLCFVTHIQFQCCGLQGLASVVLHIHVVFTVCVLASTFSFSVMDSKSSSSVFWYPMLG